MLAVTNKEVFGLSELGDDKSFLYAEVKNGLLPCSLFIPSYGLTPFEGQTTCWAIEFIHQNQFIPSNHIPLIIQLFKNVTVCIKLKLVCFLSF